GQLRLESATVMGKLTMNSLLVGENLVMCSTPEHPASFQEVDLAAAKINGQLRLESATVMGKLTMNSLLVGENLVMCSTPGRPASFEEVDLAGAKIDGQLALEGATVKGKLGMNGLQAQHLLMRSTAERTASFQEADLTAAKIDRQLDLAGASFGGKLGMNGLQAQHLLMRSTAERTASFQEVDLTAAKIEGTLALEGATVTGKLTMNGLKVARDLLVSSTAKYLTSFQEVELTAAKIEGTLGLEGANIEGKLAMNGLQVGQHLLMGSTPEHPASFREVDLTAAKIDGQLNLQGATVCGKLGMHSLQVGQHLLMGGAHFKEPITLIFGCIKANLDLSGAGFTALDLSETQISGELRLCTLREKLPRGRLVLRNTHAGALQDAWNEGTWRRDRRDAWPEVLQLDGFTYDRLGGFGDDPGSEMLNRPLDWYIAWLERDEAYSPQPYEHLADIFRKAGWPTKANKILYESRERAREKARQERLILPLSIRQPLPGWRFIGLTVLKWTMGYGLGLRYFYSLGWAFLIALIGFIVLHETDAGPASEVGKAAYSLHELLPLLNLTTTKVKNLPQGLAEIYFIFHQLAGYVLASFVAAGMGGLTQKS
ncbi:MAG: hypothetical protein WCF20_00010, partial [Methylovirgula sp.]